jgi:hypothetical protein
LVKRCQCDSIPCAWEKDVKIDSSSIGGETMKTIAIYQNIDDGVAAVIMDGNDRFTYRVVVRDIDANETITVRFCNDYSQCVEFAKTLFVDGYTIEEVAA